MNQDSGAGGCERWTQLGYIWKMEATFASVDPPSPEVFHIYVNVCPFQGPLKALHLCMNFLSVTTTATQIDSILLSRAFWQRRFGPKGALINVEDWCAKLGHTKRSWPNVPVWGHTRNVSLLSTNAGFSWTLAVLLPKTEIGWWLF